ncbi:hypothetical protein J6590_008482 [Homalodisca vitripennis]|nr:hypothetical protein J6590_008482 [Homalodisca vitripennis]
MFTVPSRASPLPQYKTAVKSKQNVSSALSSETTMGANRLRVNVNRLSETREQGLGASPGWCVCEHFPHAILAFLIKTPN